MPEAALPSHPGFAAATGPATVSTPAAERAERARRNGACSRGPITAAGKAAALRHGFCARVHLVLEGEDDDAFTALAADVLAEIAPVGTVDSFLATRLATAMWQTGRADRLEAQAFAAGELPDPDRLRLALRYRGSIGRDLFRTLRELRPQRQAAATARAEVASSPAPSPTPTAGDDDLDQGTLDLHAWGPQHAKPHVARSRPFEEVAAKPGFGTPVDQLLPDTSPPGPAPDDPTILLRHGLSLADLLAPEDDACTAEPELAPLPVAHPIAATERETTCTDTACTAEPERSAIAEPPTARPCTVDRPVTIVLGAWCRDAVCTAEPEPWHAGVADPAETGHPGALHAGATRPNEPSAPAACTREPDPCPRGRPTSWTSTAYAATATTPRAETNPEPPPATRSNPTARARPFPRAASGALPARPSTPGPACGAWRRHRRLRDRCSDLVASPMLVAPSPRPRRSKFLT